MNKVELIAQIVRKSEVSREDAKKVLDLTFATVKETLKKGGSVNLGGFGKFALSERAERWGTHPKTHEPKFYPKRIKPKFTPYKKLNQAVL